jgi:hypothetical protein
MEQETGMDNLEYLKKAVNLPVVDRRLSGSVFKEMVKLELQERGETAPPVDYKIFEEALKWIDERNDCADFYIPAFVRILHRHRGTDRLPEEWAKKIEVSLVGFKYWLDEPKEVKACFFTENHQILFHSAEYLAGQLFPEKIFPSNGQTGAWHRNHAITFIHRWLDWRTRFGFSEWLTEGYYAEDIEALLGLAYNAEEEDIRIRSLMLIDTLIFDIAVNSFQGHLSGTHGRVYTQSLVDPDTQGVTPICALCWGEGCLDKTFSDAASLLAVYGYKIPGAIRKAALDKPAVMKNLERMSIDVKDSMYYGVDPSKFDNIMLYWGIQAYSDRLVIENSLKVFPYWNWMTNRVKAYKEMYERNDEAGLPSVDTPDYTAMTQVDIATYKTPDYMISCAQDFRKGAMGYQQHPWSAYFGGKTLVYTTNPGSEDYTARPSQLAGNLFLPRAVLHENVLLCIYRINPNFVDYLYSHAYFPRAEFDEVLERDGWVFGRKGDGYIALSSLLPARWKPVNINALKAAVPGAAAPQSFDYMAPGHANVWAVEMGSKAQNGGFDKFCERFSKDAICGDTLDFCYNSPSKGKIRFGWTKDLVIGGETITIKGYKRYDNPYCDAAFNTERLEIHCGGSRTILDHKKLERQS